MSKCRFGLSRDQGTFALPTFGLQNTSLQSARQKSRVNFPGQASGGATSDSSSSKDATDEDDEDDELSNCGKEAEERTRQECRKSGKYRTIDGSCNNPKHPQWGQANTAFQRILAPEYEDGESDP